MPTWASSLEQRPVDLSFPKVEAHPDVLEVAA
jgi:hypothetical protein